MCSIEKSEGSRHIYYEVHPREGFYSSIQDEWDDMLSLLPSVMVNAEEEENALWESSSCLGVIDLDLGES